MKVSLAIACINFIGSFSYRIYKRSLMMSAWDATNGVWKGNKAVSAFDAPTLPDPLYIIGYGSLLWRPGIILEELPSFRCVCLNWKRVFLQSSTDHRGIPSFPGLVVTLLQENDIIDLLGYEISSADCFGRAWLIPKEYESALIEELDYRERGGYVKEIINIRLLESSPIHAMNTVTSAVVYAAKPNNPNFFRPIRSQDSSLSITRMCDKISVAVGPSGRNIDYVLNLVTYLNSHDLIDTYLNLIATRLRKRIGPWLARWDQLLEEYDLQPSNDVEDDSFGVVLGWGSNEYNQLAELEQSERLVLAPRSLPWSSSRERLWLLAGGGMSGFITRSGSLTIWGKHLYSSTDKSCSSYSISGVSGAAMGHEHIVILMSNGWVVSLGDLSTPSIPPFLIPPERISIKDREIVILDGEGDISMVVVKVAAGLSHSALITEDGDVYTWGDSSSGQCLASSPWKPDDGAKIIDIACGARHTVALDDQSRIWTWGDNRYNSLGRAVDNTSSSTRSQRAKIDQSPQKVSSLPSGVRWRRVKSCLPRLFVR